MAIYILVTIFDDCGAMASMYSQILEMFCIGM